MEITAIALAVLVAADAIASVLLWRARHYSRGQKVTQLALIWLVPIVGIVLVAYFLGEARAGRKTSAGFVDDVAVANGDFGGDHAVSHHDAGHDGGSGH